MRFSLVLQKEVNIKRPTGAEVDDRAGLVFFNFQESISFPQEGFLSDKHKEAFGLLIMHYRVRRKSCQVEEFSLWRLIHSKTEPLVPLVLK